MNKSLPDWAFGVLAVVGTVLAASMLFHWIDFDGAYQVRGLSLALDGNHWLLLVPLAGVALATAAATRSSWTRLAAIFAGVVVAGDVLFNVATSMVHSGLDSWLILGGAGVMLAGASPRRTSWRVVGGAAVLVGFFAPWADVSMFRMLWSDAGAEGFSVTSSFMWLIPIAGVLGVVAAGNRVTGGKLSAVAGITIYAALLVTIGLAALMIFGIGAWAALGASTVALVVGLLAGERAPIVAATKRDSAAA